MTNGASALSTPLGTVRVRAILDHEQVMSLGNLHNGVHIGHLRTQMNRDDGLRPLRYRRLDRMLRELSASRAALEHEQREARRLRAETEAVRGEYRTKLEKLQAHRDKLYRSMREDLDRAFRDAHRQIAQVVRDLQRGGTSQRAAKARESLLDLEARAADAEAKAGVANERAASLEPVEWNRIRPGDPVVVQDAGTATLVALPDRRGRVAVRLGSARVVVPMERVGAAPAQKTEPSQPAQAPVRKPSPPAAEEPGPGSNRCDLRGLRVDEALDRLVEALDRAASAGLDHFVIVHGIGTGALRRAVREHLATPYGLMLSAPPFVKTPIDVMRAVVFNPGIKENAGIFNHTQGWGVMAECMLGNGDRAYEYYRASMPAAYNDRAEIRQIEPYVQGQTTYSIYSPRPGNTRTSWLTGAAAWAYFSATQYILGLRPELDGLRIDPCIPSTWRGFKATRRFRGRTIQIEVKNPNDVCRGVKSLTLNGETLTGNLVPAERLGDQNQVKVVLG